jgi:hypothetical protein
LLPLYRSSPSEAKETRRPGGRYRTREGLPNRAALFLCAGNEKAARLRRAATDHGFEKRADPQLDFTRQHAQLGQEAAKLGFLGLGGIRCGRLPCDSPNRGQTDEPSGEELENSFELLLYSYVSKDEDHASLCLRCFGWISCRKWYCLRAGQPLDSDADPERSRISHDNRRQWHVGHIAGRDRNGSARSQFYVQPRNNPILR